MPTPTAANPRYFLSYDRQTQCLVDMDDAMHRRIWGRMTYSNRSHGVPVSRLCAEAFIEAQFAARQAAADASRNPARFAPVMERAA